MAEFTAVIALPTRKERQTIKGVFKVKGSVDKRAKLHELALVLFGLANGRNYSHQRIGILEQVKTRKRCGVF